MRVEHQVFLVLCIAYCILGIRSIVYWILGHWVLGPYALDATSRATTVGYICTCTNYILGHSRNYYLRNLSFKIVRWDMSMCLPMPGDLSA